MVRLLTSASLAALSIRSRRVTDAHCGQLNPSPVTTTLVWSVISSPSRHGIARVPRGEGRSYPNKSVYRQFSWERSLYSCFHRNLMLFPWESSPGISGEQENTACVRGSAPRNASAKFCRASGRPSADHAAAAEGFEVKSMPRERNTSPGFL